MISILTGIIGGLLALLFFALVATQQANRRSLLRRRASFIFTPWFWVALMVLLSPFYYLEATRWTWFVDYDTFLHSWVVYIREHGGWRSLADAYSNYPPPYLYILTAISYIPGYAIVPIRVVSIFFSLIGGLYLGKILYLKRPEAWVIPCALFTSLALPTVWMNGAYWAQCDSVYTSFIIISIYCLLKNRRVWAWIWIGVAFSIKLQTAFILPLFILLWMRGDSKWWMPFIFIGSVALMWLPAWLIGRPLDQLLAVYQEQTRDLYMAAVALPNLWFLCPEGTTYKSWQVILALTLVAALGIYIWIRTRKKVYTKEFIIALAMLISVAIPFLLPKMHERYAYLGDLLAIALIFYFPKLWPAAFGLQIVSLAGYMYTFAVCSRGNYYQFPYGYMFPFAILYLTCVAVLLRDFFRNRLTALRARGKRRPSGATGKII